MSEEQQSQQEKKEVKYYFGLGEVITYFFRKKDPNRPTNFNIKAMHIINRIAILMFLIAVIVMVVRFISRSM